MTIRNKNQRVVVLIDVQNLYHSAKNLYGARVNFKNLLLEAVAGRQLIRAIAYVAKADEPGEASFFDALEKSGIEVRVKDLQVYPDGTKKGDWDVGLAIDAVRLASNVDAFVLITGDGDFIPLVEYLRALGKYVEVMAFGKTTSFHLKEIVDEYLDLDSKSDYFLLAPSKKEGFYKKIPKIIKTTLKSK
ncbi:MAG: NYN domain-containing protein [Candidatus Pacebacteria bacterium]|jgi:uncharacterized LabA/DUF88 family protein|nr:NYN domain-containing protein [Candidatus Paceibacterota bacterium]